MPREVINILRALERDSSVRDRVLALVTTRATARRAEGWFPDVVAAEMARLV